MANGRAFDAHPEDFSPHERAEARRIWADLCLGIPDPPALELRIPDAFVLEARNSVCADIQKLFDANDRTIYYVVSYEIPEEAEKWHEDLGRAVRAYHELLFDKPIAYWTEAIRRNPQDADAYCKRAHAYETKGEYQCAIADYSESIRLAPQAWRYCDRGRVFTKTGKYDQGLNDFNTAIQLNQNLDPAYHLRGVLYDKIGDQARAAEDFDTARRIRSRPH